MTEREYLLNALSNEYIIAGTALSSLTLDLKKLETQEALLAKLKLDFNNFNQDNVDKIRNIFLKLTDLIELLLYLHLLSEFLVNYRNIKRNNSFDEDEFEFFLKAKINFVNRTFISNSVYCF